MIQNRNIQDLSGFLDPSGQSLILFRWQQISTGMVGRKNYLFAGSHDAAQRAAMIYSFFAMCKIEEVNPQQWLKYVFDNIMDTNIQELLPKNYKLSLVKKSD